jgi:hypothetical protein
VIFAPSSTPCPAADGLPAADGAASEPAADGAATDGAADGGAADDPVDGLDVVPGPHAEKISTKMTARAGNLNWYRIPCLLHAGPGQGFAVMITASRTWDQWLH